LAATAQPNAEPVREQLLNGLTVLFSQRPGDPNVLIKLRVRSGAAFDTAGKGGSMALLGDALFPDPATREYVNEQLGGKLEVITNYDGIDITISGKVSELERLVDLLRIALVTTQLTPENVAGVRDGRLKQFSDKPLSAAEIADQAIAARLFGSYPYGHPAVGTVETVAKIDRADLLHARERFLNADNATVVVIGGVEPTRLRRTLRQLLGPWQKGDRVVPSTFRQPNAPDARVLVVNQTGATTAEIRLAVRGLARSDRDAAAATLLAQIARERWLAAAPDLSQVFVRHEAYALPGSFVLGASVPNASVSKAVAAAQQTIRSLAQTGPTVAELDRARSEMLADLSRRTSQPETIADLWLDLDTFKLPPLQAQMNSIQGLTVQDVQRVAVRLFKDASPATIVVGDADQLKSGFVGSIEVRSEKLEVKTAADPTPTKAPPVKKP
ncbi:MAG: M16 family metallopeptidase, partial [Pyrinomonadaceae bacterium]